MQNDNSKNVTNLSPEGQGIQSAESQVSPQSFEKSHERAVKNLVTVPDPVMDAVMAVVHTTLTSQQVGYVLASVSIDRLLKTEVEYKFKDELRNRAQRIDALLRKWGYPASSLQSSDICFELNLNALIMRLIAEKSQENLKTRMTEYLVKLDLYIDSLKPLTKKSLDSPIKCNGYVDEFFCSLLRLTLDF